MKEPLAELAAYSCPWYQVPDADLVRLTDVDYADRVVGVNRHTRAPVQGQCRAS